MYILSFTFLSFWSIFKLYNVYSPSFVTDINSRLHAFNSSKKPLNLSNSTLFTINSYGVFSCPSPSTRSITSWVNPGLSCSGFSVSGVLGSSGSIGCSVSGTLGVSSSVGGCSSSIGGCSGVSGILGVSSSVGGTLGTSGSSSVGGTSGISGTSGSSSTGGTSSSVGGCSSSTGGISSSIIVVSSKKLNILPLAYIFLSPSLFPYVSVGTNVRYLHFVASSKSIVLTEVLLANPVTLPDLTQVSPSKLVYTSAFFILPFWPPGVYSNEVIYLSLSKDTL